MEDRIRGMNVFPLILMLFLTLACIAYLAHRIQALFYFFETVENPIFKTIVNAFHGVKRKESTYSQQLQSKGNTIWNILNSVY